MDKEVTSENQAIVRRLRLVLLVPLVCIVFVVILRYLLLGIFETRHALGSLRGMFQRLSSWAWPSCISCARSEKKARDPTRPPGRSTSPDVANPSHCQAAPPSRRTRHTRFQNWYHVTSLLTMRSTGEPGVDCGVLFSAIVDLLATKQRLTAGHEKLSREIALRKQIEATLRESEGMLKAMGLPPRCRDHDEQCRPRQLLESRPPRKSSAIRRKRCSDSPPTRSLRRNDIVKHTRPVFLRGSPRAEGRSSAGRSN